jgi:hypothetical protein
LRKRKEKRPNTSGPLGDCNPAFGVDESGRYFTVFTPEQGISLLGQVTHIRYSELKHQCAEFTDSHARFNTLVRRFDLILEE